MPIKLLLEPVYFFMRVLKLLDLIKSLFKGSLDWQYWLERSEME